MLLRFAVAFLEFLLSPLVAVGHNRSEPLFEYCLAIRVDFVEGDGSEAGPLGGEGEAADAAKEIKVSWFMVHGFQSLSAAT